MARPDSPMEDSPLSSMSSSEDEYPDEATEVMDDGPPAKRQKTAPRSTTPSAVVADPDADPDPLEGMSDVSSDTDGDIPSSPVNARQDEDDFQEQITVCEWEGCKAGDMGNMDKLVEHIHNDHIESRQKRYTCEWVSCGRKGIPHASGYALKAHMRSHTREKPFYCYLPECDRAFTRSDALAKHMRTVHETEALRPSDPVPKSMQSAAGAGGKSSKLKIIIKTPQSHAAGQDDAVDDGSVGDDSSGEMFTPLTEDQGFTPEERSMSLPRLMKLCKLQVKWAEEEGEVLRTECQRWEELYKREWLEKEVLLEQMIRSEEEWHRRRQAVLSGAADVVVAANGDAVDSGADTTQKMVVTTD
ncbi:INO80 complex subunit 1 [Madurella fahalii]|uniref:INO80 complex subunit 1 n=1 Tax=Madurella fahalii TaxID=1157608 RepID=A0ABQ0FYE4_9PEZI